MAEEFLFGPVLATMGTFVVLNCIYCCLGVRRIRRIEQRIHTLEERQIALPQLQQQPIYSPTTYIQPTAPNYTYYQTPPTATAYYPQDPQVIYR